MIPSARNFDSGARQSDLSCLFWSRGCLDSTAANYASNVNIDDGSCVPTSVPSPPYRLEGCMDETALNYDSKATLSSNCAYSVVGCMDEDSLNYMVSANTADLSACIPVRHGCMVARIAGLGHPVHIK